MDRRRLDTPSGFDFTAHMRVLCEDIVTRSPEMNHISMKRVAVSFAQTRKAVQHGMWASLTPMRFANGALEENRRGRRYTVQRLYGKDGKEMLYILTFYMPRFMELSFEDKLVTIFHELWHISPNFDGDIRRHPGRCYVHTTSEEEYDRQMAKLARRWMKADPPNHIYEFLRCDFAKLEQRFGRVFGTRIRNPKLIPVKR
jgi:predicted metallopeptidase